MPPLAVPWRSGIATSGGSGAITVGRLLQFQGATGSLPLGALGPSQFPTSRSSRALCTRPPLGDSGPSKFAAPRSSRAFTLHRLWEIRVHHILPPLSVPGPSHFARLSELQSHNIFPPPCSSRAFRLRPPLRAPAPSLFATHSSSRALRLRPTLGPSGPSHFAVSRSSRAIRDEHI